MFLGFHVGFGVPRICWVPGKGQERVAKCCGQWECRTCNWMSNRKNQGFYLEGLGSGVCGVKAWCCEGWGRPIGSDRMYGCGRLMEGKGKHGNLHQRPTGHHGTQWTFTQGLWGPDWRGGLNFVLSKVIHAFEHSASSQISHHESI